MCGIAGHYSHKSQFVSIEKALKHFRHRGPDSTAEYQVSNVKMGYNRLAITNVASGQQPIFNTDKSIVVFYNGEIYNHQNLRKEIEKHSKFRLNQVDGAVIPYLYELYGETFAEKLDGMYAIALYDKKRNRLLLARDIVGEKPLYYWHDNTDLMFSSSLLGLKSMVGGEVSLNYQGVWDFPSFLWIPEPHSIFKEFHALMPGQTLIFNSNGFVKSFSQDFISTSQAPDSIFALDFDTGLTDELFSTLESSVVSMIPSEVPFGTFLSSGLDSSIISTLALQHSKNRELHTFCVRFPNLSDPYHGFSDESDFAAEYAEMLGTTHHTINADSKTILDSLDDFVQLSDSPFAVSSGLGVFLVSKMARELGLKVLLSGDGADELYGGYSWYKHLTEISRIFNEEADEKHFKIDEKQVTFQNVNLSTQSLIETVGRYARSELVFALHYYMLESEKKSLFSKTFAQNSLSSYRLTEIASSGELRPIDIVNHDRKFYLSQEMMRKVDRYTMSHSIEGRVPFVSARSLNLSSQLAFSELVKDDSLKVSLRKAFSKILPPVLTQRNKHGFNVPIDHWLKNEWSFLISETFSKDSMLAELQLIDSHSESVANLMVRDKTRLSGHSIFALIVLEKWLNYVFRTEG